MKDHCVECGAYAGDRYHPADFCFLVRRGWDEKRIAAFVAEAAPWLNPDGTWRRVAERPRKAGSDADD